MVHCGQGRSRSTAATAVTAAALGAEPDIALGQSRRAHETSFRWDATRPWQPNQRILAVGSTEIYGDERLAHARG